MTDLIACLSAENSSSSHVSKVIEGQAWGKIILVANEATNQKFSTDKPAERVVIDIKQPVEEIIKHLAKQFKEKITDTEVAVNLASGSGKEHMAILSAVMKAGLAFRLIALTKDGVKEI